MVLNARKMALADMVNWIGTADGSCGIVPASTANRYLSQEEKDKVKREWDKLYWQMSRRLDRMA